MGHCRIPFMTQLESFPASQSFQFQRRSIQTLFIILLGMLQVSCASLQVTRGTHVLGAGHNIATNVTDCISLLGREKSSSAQGLVAPIELLSWNIKKGAGPAWRSDLRNLASGMEFVALQEVVLESGIGAELPQHRHVSFSQGYTTASRTSGVATFSTSAPRSECHFSVIEPLLRSPKATNVAEYRLRDHKQTLVVVNLHAVNFTLGLGRFNEQMRQIRQVIATHDGPAIMSGDFNTWSRRRTEVVTELVSDLGFSSVELTDDSRKTFNGYPLDHIFIRGFSSFSARSLDVESSDHNPLTVELVL